MKDKIKTLLIGLALGLGISGNFREVAAVTAALGVVVMFDFMLPTKVVSTTRPKVIHLFVPGETHDIVKEEAEKVKLTLAEFAALGLTLAITLSQAIRKKGSIVVRMPGEQEQIIDAI